MEQIEIREPEIWDDAPGFDGYYLVSSHGNIKSVDRIITDKNGNDKKIKGKIRCQFLHSEGYLNVMFCKNCHYQTFYSHRLVAKLFVPNPHNYEFVNHEDCDKTNNYYKNLKWVSFQENMDHASENGLIKPNGLKGVQTGSCKLTESQVIEIRKLPHINAKKVAIIYGVTEGALWGIWKNKTWKHL